MGTRGFDRQKRKEVLRAKDARELFKKTKTKKGSKYCYFDGIKFDSIAERDFYIRLLEAGIPKSAITCHPKIQSFL